jgi:hypothetical protein
MPKCQKCRNKCSWNFLYYSLSLVFFYFHLFFHFHLLQRPRKAFKHAQPREVPQSAGHSALGRAAVSSTSSSFSATAASTSALADVKAYKSSAVVNGDVEV